MMALKFGSGGYGLQATGNSVNQEKEGRCVTALPATICGAPVPQGTGAII
jgi:hypothetical protein